MGGDVDPRYNFLLNRGQFFLYPPFRPEQIELAERLQPPSGRHLFGTDHLGRDIFSRVLVGGRSSLLIGVGAVCLGAAAGIVLGLAAGYGGGLADELAMRGSDGLQSLPSLLLALLLATIWRPGSAVILWAVAVGNIPIFLRLTRNQVLSIKARPYIEAARSVGGRAMGRFCGGIFCLILAMLSSPVLSELGRGNSGGGVPQLSGGGYPASPAQLGGQDAQGSASICRTGSVACYRAGPGHRFDCDWF